MDMGVIYSLKQHHKSVLESRKNYSAKLCGLTPTDVSLLDALFLVGAFLKSTIVMAFRQCFFFDTPEVSKIVLPKPKVLQNFKTPNCTFRPKELDYKSCSFFSIT